MGPLFLLKQCFVYLLRALFEAMEKNGIPKYNLPKEEPDKPTAPPQSPPKAPVQATPVRSLKKLSNIARGTPKARQALHTPSGPAPVLKLPGNKLKRSPLGKQKKSTIMLAKHMSYEKG